MEFDENLGIQALLPSWQSQLVIFNKSLFIIGRYLRYLQFWRLVPHFHDFLSSAHMTLTVQSVRSVGFGMLIEWCKFHVDRTTGKRVLNHLQFLIKITTKLLFKATIKVSRYLSTTHSHLVTGERTIPLSMASVHVL